MTTELKVILIILAVVVGLCLLATLGVLFLLAPGKRRREIEKYKTVKFAHRGLHGEGIAENSISAFAAAKQEGFGIELDVQLSGDGELVVFHDATLNRVCGVDGRVKDFTAAELSRMSLNGTSEGIPTLSQVLELIDGAVPLLIEIKMENGESGIAEKLVEVIEGYKGDYIVESFNPLGLRVMKKLRPDVMRGILSCVYMKKEEYRGKLLYRLLENLMLNFLCRPDFIAYEQIGYAKTSLRFIRRAFGTPLFAWTIRSGDEETQAISHGFDTVIFEGYIPEK